jgi:hypothetical protein
VRASTQAHTVKGYGKVGALVPHTVDAELVGHVRNRVLAVRLFGHDLHRAVGAGLGEGVSRLGHLALEDLHQAVGVAVVVDRAALAGGPYEYKLCIATWLVSSEEELVVLGMT